MKGPQVAIVTISGAALFILVTLWWRHSGSHGINALTFLSHLRPATSSPLSLQAADAHPIRDKVAVIVETRPSRALIPLIQHFAGVLGPEWPILFFTRTATIRTLEAFTQGSQPFKRMVNHGQVKIIELPTDPPLGNYQNISHFLASEWFWKQMDPAKHMLLFQTDSILCANSGRRVEDFFEYDFVGAAHPYLLDAFNGGLSLRNVTLSQEVVRLSNIADDVVNGTGFGKFEDVWFCDKMKDLGGRFPTRERASEFAVDHIWAESPLGYHGINKGVQIERTEAIYKWCPEAALGASSKEILDLITGEHGNNAIVEDAVAGGNRLSFENTTNP